jgi:membrane-associated phospholipid phosphatase
LSIFISNLRPPVLKKVFLIKVFLFLITPNIWGQDTIGHTSQRDIKVEFIRSSLVPVVLIGYGGSTIGDWGIYSSQDFQRSIRGQFPVMQTQLDSYFRFAPLLGLAVLKMTNMPSKSDRINTGVIFLKSQVLMTSIVYALKYSTAIYRPNGLPYAFPSGHSAQAFLGAALIHKEYKKFSYWPGIIAYTLATATSAIRILKDEHWKSDVLTGAGIGILSVNLVYLTHKYKWREPKVLKF